MPITGEMVENMKFQNSPFYEKVLIATLKLRNKHLKWADILNTGFCIQWATDVGLYTVKESENILFRQTNSGKGGIM